MYVPPCQCPTTTGGGVMHRDGCWLAPVQPMHEETKPPYRITTPDPAFDRDEIALRFAVALTGNADFSDSAWESIAAFAYRGADAFLAERLQQKGPSDGR